MFLVSLRWWKDHDVSQLVNKLRFHIASTIDQNGRPPRKMEGCSSKCCKYHMQNPANTMQHERVCIILYIYISSKCRRCHAKRDVLPSQCRLTWQNAENMKILKIPRKQRVSIWLPLWVYECAIWAFHCTIMALSSLNSVVCFSVFWPWWFRQFSFFLALRSFIRVSWLHLFICSLQPKPQS